MNSEDERESVFDESVTIFANSDSRPSNRHIWLQMSPAAAGIHREGWFFSREV